MSALTTLVVLCFSRYSERASSVLLALTSTFSHARIGPPSGMHGSAGSRVPPPDGMPPRQRLTTAWEGSGVLRLGGRTL